MLGIQAQGKWGARPGALTPVSAHFHRATVCRLGKLTPVKDLFPRMVPCGSTYSNNAHFPNTTGHWKQTYTKEPNFLKQIREGTGRRGKESKGIPTSILDWSEYRLLNTSCCVSCSSFLRINNIQDPDALRNTHLHKKTMSSEGVLTVLTLVNGHFLWMISCRVGALIPAKAHFFRMTCYPKETNIEGSN